MADEVVVRTYQADTQEEAALLYAQDAPIMADDGWVPITQAWATGEWPTSWYALAALGAVFGVGLFILGMLFIFKPSGTLIVTYGRGSMIGGP